MITSAGGTGSGDPDMVLIGELMEEISRRPPAVAARKLLIEHYIAVGWGEAALDNTRELRSLAPGDNDVAKFLQLLERKPEPPVADIATRPQRPVNVTGQVKESTLIWDTKTGQYKKAPVVNVKEEEQVVIDIGDDLDTAKQELVEGYLALRARADFIMRDLMHLQTLQKTENMVPSGNTARVKRIVGGRAEISTQLCNVRTTARLMRDRPEIATEVALADMEEAMKFYKNSPVHVPGTSTDTLRDALIKRKAALELILPDELKIHCEAALMHMEHEHLARNYANTETMYGDAVKDIARTNFYVTEDNYAWDMEELVAAIKAGSGVPRNPLSKQMFTPKDVKGIYLHPLAKALAALAVEQKEMSRGVRPETIDRLGKLSKILLEDQSTETLPSRHAVDEFLAYIATLPELEQKAINGLKCPASDSHTGQAYDSSIGEAVRDAKGNRVCFHKTGDFIGQAATFLRKQKGVAPDPEKCPTM